MIHIARPSSTRTLDVHLLVTGPGARVAETWDPSSSTATLDDHGLIDLDALEPLNRKGLLTAIDARMASHPTAGDAGTALVARDLGAISMEGDYGAARVPSAVEGIGGIIVPTISTLPNHLLATYAHERIGPWAPRDPFTLYHHEAAHALTSVLTNLRRIDVALASIIAAALHREELPNLTIIGSEERLGIAQQISPYAATGGYDEHGDLIDTDRPAARPDWGSLLAEMCAEAYARDTPSNRERLPLVRGICQFLDAVLGRDSPIAQAINTERHRTLAIATYLRRTRPAAVRDLRAVELGLPPSSLENDADLHWELENPQRPPAWLLQSLSSSTGFSADDCAQRLMHTPLYELAATDPSGRPAGAGEAWHNAMSDLLWKRLDAFIRVPGFQLDAAVEAATEDICAALRAATLPALGPNPYAMDHNGHIVVSATGRRHRELPPHEYLALATTGNLASFEGLPPTWLPAEIERLRTIASLRATEICAMPSRAASSLPMGASGSSSPVRGRATRRSSTAPPPAASQGDAAASTQEATAGSTDGTARRLGIDGTAGAPTTDRPTAGQPRPGPRIGW